MLKHLQKFQGLGFRVLGFGMSEDMLDWKVLGLGYATVLGLFCL